MMVAQKYHLVLKESTDSYKYDKKTQNPNAVAKLAREILGDDIDVQENVYAIYYNGHLQVVGVAHICKGATDSAIISPKILYKYAIELLANQFILFHNHPSGYTKPSSHDIHLTNELVKASKLLDINFLDHLIITKNDFYSFNGHGLIGERNENN